MFLKITIDRPYGAAEMMYSGDRKTATQLASLLGIRYRWTGEIGVEYCEEVWERLRTLSNERGGNIPSEYADRPSAGRIYYYSTPGTPPLANKHENTGETSNDRHRPCLCPAKHEEASYPVIASADCISRCFYAARSIPVRALALIPGRRAKFA